MASLQKVQREGKPATYRLWVGTEPNRKSARLGVLSDKQAATLLDEVLRIEASIKYGDRLEPATQNWLNRLGDEVFQKLVSVGLVEPRPIQTLIDYWDAFLKRLDVGTGTMARIKSARNIVKKRVGNVPLKDITADVVTDWMTTMKADYSAAYVSKTAKEFRRVVRAAIKAGLIYNDPFDGVSIGNEENQDRQRFITQRDVSKVLEAATDTEFRLIIALSRYAGLRIPSELIPLRWSDVNWEKGLLLVSDVKRKQKRFVPLFAELRPYLDAAWNEYMEREDDDRKDFIITRYRDSSVNLRSRLKQTISRAGLEPWPRLWQNMRSSRETELADHFPIQVVTSWIGNTATVAAKHYLQVTESHIERAITSATKSEKSGAELTADSSENTTFQGPKDGAEVVQNRCGGANSVQNGKARSAKSPRKRALGRTESHPKEVVITRQGFEP